MEVDQNDRDFLVREVTSLTENSLDRLFELWAMIGIKNLRQNRVEPVIEHFKELCKKMITEEEASLDKITKNIKKYNRDRIELHKDLGENYKNDTKEEEMSLVDVEYKIRCEVVILTERKAKRMEVYDDIRKAEQSLCEATGSLPLNLVIDRMPTDGQVKQIEKYIIKLKDLRNTRETEFEELTDKIRRMYDKLEIEPRNSEERHLICSNIESIQLSSETMTAINDLLQNLEFEMSTNTETAKDIIEKMRSIAEKLKMPFDLASMQHEFYSTRMIHSLREELNTLEVERSKHMDVFIKSAQTELDQIWEKCYVSDDVKTTFYAVLETKDDQESILTHYEAHLDNWKKFLDDHLLVISRVSEWFQLWDDRLQLETQSKDPSRLGNFKVLREEEKRRNKVNKRLPKVVEEIQKLTAKYFDDNGKDFLIQGMTFDELNQHQEIKHEREVSMEKEKKKQDKKKLIASETIYGVSKVTPRSANKTVRQVKRLQHDSKLLGKSGFLTPRPRTPAPRTPGRMALRERNKDDSYISGSNMTKSSVASVGKNTNIFSNADVASSTLRHDQLKKVLTPIKRRSPLRSNPLSSLKKSANKSRDLRSGKKVPFLF